MWFTFQKSKQNFFSYFFPFFLSFERRIHSGTPFIFFFWSPISNPNCSRPKLGTQTRIMLYVYHQWNINKKCKIKPKKQRLKFCFSFLLGSFWPWWKCAQDHPGCPWFYYFSHQNSLREFFLLWNLLLCMKMSNFLRKLATRPNNFWRISRPISTSVTKKALPPIFIGNSQKNHEKNSWNFVYIQAT